MQDKINYILLMKWVILCNCFVKEISWNFISFIYLCTRGAHLWQIRDSHVLVNTFKSFVRVLNWSLYCSPYIATIHSVLFCLKHVVLFLNQVVNPKGDKLILEIVYVILCPMLHTKPECSWLWYRIRWAFNQ